MPIVIQACAKGRIRVNPVAGIRIRNVMASEAAWRAGHKAAVVPSLTGAGLAVVLSLVSLYPALSPATQSAIVFAAAVVLVVALTIGAFLANRAALEEIALEFNNDVSASSDVH
ncbi:MAG TPA: SdpI family protein [Terrimesophilobacter sp.]|nr:SdpI family protein [Terrimesophilobacter sp.]